MESSRNIKITAFGKTDVGLIREHNEDNFLLADVDAGLKTSSLDDNLQFTLGAKGALFLVCDGMGGAAAGEVASTMAVETIAAEMEKRTPSTREGFARSMRRAVELTNEKINLQSRINQNERGMGTTCTAVGLMDRNLLVGQIGDSRCYVLRGKALAQITKDQSLAWQLIEAGAMTVEEAKSFEHANIILQALGVQEKVDVILSSVPLCRGDVVLVSSDGLHGPVTDDEMRDILLAESDPKKACEALIGKALDREGPDNITVVVARFEGDGLPEPQEQQEEEVSAILGFVAYDPGIDPDDPEPRRRTSGMAVEKITEELIVHADAIEATTKGAMPISLSSPTGSTPVTSTELSASDEPASRPFLTFILVTLLAALGGAIFLAFQQGHVPDLPDSKTTGSPTHEPTPTTEPTNKPTNEIDETTAGGSH